MFDPKDTRPATRPLLPPPPFDPLSDPQKPVPASAAGPVIDPLEFTDAQNLEQSAQMSRFLRSAYQAGSQYDAGIVENANQRDWRAATQPLRDKMANATGSFLLNFLPQTVGAFYSALDWSDAIGIDDKPGNAVQDFADSWKKDMDAAMPIYGEESAGTLDFGNANWWISRGRDLTTSVASFVVPGGVIARGTSAVAGLAKGALMARRAEQLVAAGADAARIAQEAGKITSYASRAQMVAADAAQLAARLASAGMMANAEAVMAGGQVYKEEYERTLKEDKPGANRKHNQEEAHALAAAAASRTANIMRMNMLLELGAVSRFITPARHTRMEFGKKGLLPYMGELLGESTHEYMEEAVGHIAEQEGSRLAEAKRAGKEYQYELSRTLGDALSAEGLESGLLGFGAGAGQTLLTDAWKKASGAIDTQEPHRQAQLNYLKALDDHARAHGLPSSLGLADSLAAQAGYHSEYDALVKAGKTAEADALSAKMFSRQAYAAFEVGAAERFRMNIEQVAGLDEESAAAMGMDAKTYRAQAAEALKRFDRLERMYLGIGETDNAVRREVYNALSAKEDMERMAAVLNKEAEEMLPEARRFSDEMKNKSLTRITGKQEKEIHYYGVPASYLNNVYNVEKETRKHLNDLNKKESEQEIQDFLDKEDSYPKRENGTILHYESEEKMKIESDLERMIKNKDQIDLSPKTLSETILNPLPPTLRTYVRNQKIFKNLIDKEGEALAARNRVQQYEQQAAALLAGKAQERIAARAKQNAETIARRDAQRRKDAAAKGSALMEAPDTGVPLGAQIEQGAAKGTPQEQEATRLALARHIAATRTGADGYAVLDDADRAALGLAAGMTRMKLDTNQMPVYVATPIGASQRNANNEMIAPPAQVPVQAVPGSPLAVDSISDDAWADFQEGKPVPDNIIYSLALKSAQGGVLAVDRETPIALANQEKFARMKAEALKTAAPAKKEPSKNKPEPVGSLQRIDPKELGEMTFEEEMRAASEGADAAVGGNQGSLPAANLPANEAPAGRIITRTPLSAEELGLETSFEQFPDERRSMEDDLSQRPAYNPFADEGPLPNINLYEEEEESPPTPLQPPVPAAAAPAIQAPAIQAPAPLPVAPPPPAMGTHLVMAFDETDTAGGIDFSLANTPGVIKAGDTVWMTAEEITYKAGSPPVKAVVLSLDQGGSQRFGYLSRQHYPQQFEQLFWKLLESGSAQVEVTERITPSAKDQKKNVGAGIRKKPQTALSEWLAQAKANVLFSGKPVFAHVRAAGKSTPGKVYLSGNREGMMIAPLEADTNGRSNKTYLMVSGLKGEGFPVEMLALPLKDTASGRAALQRMEAEIAAFAATEPLFRSESKSAEADIELNRKFRAVREKFSEYIWFDNSHMLQVVWNNLAKSYQVQYIQVSADGKKKSFATTRRTIMEALGNRLFAVNGEMLASPAPYVSLLDGTRHASYGDFLASLDVFSLDVDPVVPWKASMTYVDTTSFSRPAPASASPSPAATIVEQSSETPAGIELPKSTSIPLFEEETFMPPATPPAPAQFVQTQEAPATETPLTEAPLPAETIAPVVEEIPMDEAEEAERKKKMAVKRNRRAAMRSTASGLSAPVWNREKEMGWLSRVLPQVGTRLLSDTLAVAEKFGTEGWGAFHDAIIYLANNAKRGTAYHEAFHAVFRMYVPEDLQERMLLETAEAHGLSTPLSAEERLAEEFSDYMITEEARHPLATSVLDFFRDIYYWVRNLAGLNRFQDLAHRIRRGGFRNAVTQASYLDGMQADTAVAPEGVPRIETAPDSGYLADGVVLRAAQADAQGEQWRFEDRSANVLDMASDGLFRLSDLIGQGVTTRAEVEAAAMERHPGMEAGAAVSRMLLDAGYDAVEFSEAAGKVRIVLDASKLSPVEKRFLPSRGPAFSTADIYPFQRKKLIVEGHSNRLLSEMIYEKGAKDLMSLGNVTAEQFLEARKNTLVLYKMDLEDAPEGSELKANLAYFLKNYAAMEQLAIAELARYGYRISAPIASGSDTESETEDAAPEPDADEDEFPENGARAADGDGAPLAESLEMTDAVSGEDKIYGRASIEEDSRDGLGPGLKRWLWALPMVELTPGGGYDLVLNELGDNRLIDGAEAYTALCKLLVGVPDTVRMEERLRDAASKAHPWMAHVAAAVADADRTYTSPDGFAVHNLRNALFMHFSMEENHLHVHLSTERVVTGRDGKPARDPFDNSIVRTSTHYSFEGNRKSLPRRLFKGWLRASLQREGHDAEADSKYAALMPLVAAVDEAKRRSDLHRSITRPGRRGAPARTPKAVFDDALAKWDAEIAKQQAELARKNAIYSNRAPSENAEAIAEKDRKSLELTRSRIEAAVKSRFDVIKMMGEDDWHDEDGEAAAATAQRLAAQMEDASLAADEALSELFRGIGIAISPEAFRLIRARGWRKRETFAASLGRSGAAYVVSAHAKGRDVFKTESDSVLKLAQAEAMASAENGAATTTTVDGKLVYLFSKASYASRTLQRLFADGKAWAARLESNPMHAGSVLAGLASDNNPLWLQTRILDGISERKGKRKRTISYTQLTAKDSWAFRFTSWFNNGRTAEGREMGWFMGPTPADRGVALMYAMPKMKHDLSKPVFLEDGTLDPSQPAWAYVLGLFQQETARIRQTHRDMEKIEAHRLATGEDKRVANYHYGSLNADGTIATAGNAFYYNLFPSLNALCYAQANEDGSIPAVPSMADLVVPDTEVIRLELSRVIRADFDAQLRQMKAAGVVSLGRDGKPMLSSTQQLLLGTSSSGAALAKKLDEFFFDSMMATVEITRLHQSDIAFNKWSDYTKGALSDAQVADANKRFGAAQVPGHSRAVSTGEHHTGMAPTFNVSINKDVKEKSALLAAYTEAVFLSEGYAPRPETKAFLFTAASKLTPQQVAAFTPQERRIRAALMPYQSIDTTDAQAYGLVSRLRSLMIGEGRFTSDVARDLAAMEKGEATWGKSKSTYPVNKDFFYGMTDLGVKGVELEVPFLYKYSTFWLTPAFGKRHPALGALHDSLVASSAQEATFGSAVKMGVRNIGSITDAVKPVVTLPSRDHTKVQEKKSKDAVEGNFGVQAKKLVMMDLDNNADFSASMPQELFAATGMEATGSSLKAIYNRLITAKTEIGRRKAEKKTSTEQAVVKEALEGERKRPLSLGLIAEALTYVGGRTRLALSHPVVARRLQSQVFSAYRRHVSRTKMPGISAVQVSSMGIVHKDAELKGLRLSEDGTRVLPAEIVVSPAYFLNLMKQKKVDASLFLDKDGFLKLDKIDPALLDTVLYRIPTGGKNAIIPARIVDFALPENGEVIFVPKELIVSTGSDFDVDTLYVTFRHARIRKGRLESLPQEGDPLQRREDGTLDEKRVDDAIFTLMHGALTHPSVFADLFAPDTTAELFSARSEIRRRRARREAASGVPARVNHWWSAGMQEQLRERNKAGGENIGFYAIATTYHAVTQDMKLNDSTEAAAYQAHLAQGMQPPAWLSAQAINLSRTHDEDGAKVSLNLRQHQSAALDNAKDPVAGEINDNLLTAPFTLYLLKAGIGPRKAALWRCQPDVEAFTAIHARQAAPSPRRALADAIREYDRTYGTKYAKADFENAPPIRMSLWETTAEQLSERIEKAGEKDSEALATYLHYRYKGDQLSRQARAMNIDSKGVQSLAVRNADLLSRKSDIYDNPVASLDTAAYEASYTASYWRNSVEAAMEAARGLFVEADPAFLAFARSVKRDFGFYDPNDMSRLAGAYHAWTHASSPYVSQLFASGRADVLMKGDKATGVQSLAERIAAHQREKAGTDDFFVRLIDVETAQDRAQSAQEYTERYDNEGTSRRATDTDYVSVNLSVMKGLSDDDLMNLREKLKEQYHKETSALQTEPIVNNNIGKQSPVRQFKGEYSWLSNFAPANIFVNGIIYPSVEHAFMSGKSDDAAWKKFCSDPNNSAATVKKEGRKINLRSDWEQVKIAWMKKCLESKFLQEPFKTKLQETGQRLLEEGNSWNDTFWGISLNTGKGENHLGRLIMEIRSEILLGTSGSVVPENANSGFFQKPKTLVRDLFDYAMVTGSFASEARNILEMMPLAIWEETGLAEWQRRNAGESEGGFRDKDVSMTDPTALASLRLQFLANNLDRAGVRTIYDRASLKDFDGEAYRLEETGTVYVRTAEGYRPVAPLGNGSEIAEYGPHLSEGTARVC